MHFTTVERKVLEGIAARNFPGVEALRAQLAVAVVESREMTGVGFYTRIFVPRDVEPLPDKQALRTALFDAPCAKVASAPDQLLLFHLWEDGERYLCCLEGVTTADSWPQDEGDIVVLSHSEP